MPKKFKLKTPEWILEGYSSKEEYEKSKGVNSKKSPGKVFKIRECPKCGGDNVGVVLSNSNSEEGGGKEWECRECKWNGKNIKEKELTEDEFMRYLDEKGEELPDEDELKKDFKREIVGDGEEEGDLEE